MSYLDSYQFDLDQEIAAERAAGYHSCPRCGGHPDYDETGRPYTCFFCENTGCVPAAVVEQFARDERDAMEAFAPVRLGVFPTQEESFWESANDEEIAAETRPGRRLFTRFIRPQPTYAVYANGEFDDIPF
jgi:hypothetical protein